MTINQHVEEILKRLAQHKNVLLLGPPATGKSKIMAAVAEKFGISQVAGIASGTLVPIPKVAAPIQPWMPSPGITANRDHYFIAFHQGTKHRDFVSGIVPVLEKDKSGFRITKGILIHANDNALSQKGASLLIIDEINRGPAVTIFGDTLTSIEADKRLAEDNSKTSDSFSFQAFDEGTGELKPTFLSPHVYIMASMNEADSSVEPLDVAFLRRFKPYRLYPDSQVLREFLNVPQNNAALPDQAATKEHIFEAIIRAWEKINQRISIGRGDFFQIGHGILLGSGIPADLPAAQTYALDSWQKIEAHVREVFFGNDIALSVVFNAKEDGFYKLKEESFGDQSISKLYFPDSKEAEIYMLLKQVAANGA